MSLTEEKTHILGERIISVLRSIYDPEIPVDVYELGLIYDVQISDEADIKIIMTLTTPNCPVAETLPEEVKQKVQAIDEVREVDLTLTFDPPWSSEMLSEEARLELGML
ncbi:iron-sulfur cluster assembly protein [Bacteroidetes bacterium endosymbiont of Geopemphigus sp.]|uniref:iron-sulfur cluster assembly protein n=1 Tax=Bacteroidetes bacterium endosymbiont of Geopemphigus sp. TaxID=2047937 RepID=UPI000CD20533|nr:iron-sulfur cluster assembly protein [Bacteroidetes bacterium endosymbiont of Geopemphigus sp.]